MSVSLAVHTDHSIDLGPTVLAALPGTGSSGTVTLQGHAGCSQA